MRVREAAASPTPLRGCARFCLFGDGCGVRAIADRPTGARICEALGQGAEPLLPSAASGCHLPRGGRLSYFSSMRHCRSASKSCLNSVPHWNFRLLLPPLAAQPSVLSRRNRICTVTPARRPHSSISLEWVSKGPNGPSRSPEAAPLVEECRGGKASSAPVNVT